MLVAVLFTSAAAPATASAGAFCEGEVVHDYLKPLQGLPELRPIPSGGELPFGPHGVVVRKSVSPPLVIPRQSVGYGFVFRPHSPPASHPDLRWRVTAKLVRVDRRGAPLKTVAVTGRTIRRIGGGLIDLFFAFRFRPGLYKRTLLIENASGKVLGRFGEYLRAVVPTPPTSRLQLDRATVHPGETVSALAEEPGVGWLSMRDTYSIESFDGSTWQRAAITPVQYSILIGPSLEPGEATSPACWRFTVPSNASAGTYRMRVNAERSRNGYRLEPAAEGKPQTLALTAEFLID